jgi:hypothetical protein
VRELASRAWTGLVPRADLGVVAALCALYALSFDPRSAVNGALFQTDSVYILDSLAHANAYPYNPQNHLLYHLLVERGYALWRAGFGPGPGSLYAFLKLFTAATGLAFLLSLRLLLHSMGLGSLARAAVLGLAGVSVSAWFHYAAFETHGLVLPGLTLALFALQRLARSEAPSPGSHALLVGCLLLCGLARSDAWRFTLLCAPLPLLPAFRRHARALLRDVAAVGLLGAVLSVALAHGYFSLPWGEAAHKLLERRDHPLLAARMARLENLGQLGSMTRAAAIYAFAMPLAAGPPAAAPGRRGARVRDAVFEAPLAGLLRDPGAALLLGGLLGLWLLALVRCARRLRALEPFSVVLASQWLASLLFFTWWDPREPFLWILEFLPLSVALLADSLPADRRLPWIGVAGLAVLLWVHNLRFFYLPFR